MTTPDLDPYDVRLVRGALGALGACNAAGVLAAADVHVALRLATLGGGEADEDVLLAAALAVRAPRLGHVCTDLRDIGTNVAVDVDFPVDLPALPWPDPGAWLEKLSASPLVGLGAATGDRPLRLVGSLLYLDRYWREERRVAADLLSRAGDLGTGFDRDVLSAGLARLFPDARTDEPDSQRRAAESAVLRRLTVVAGGPGTGKTTTVARILALLEEQAEAAGVRPPLVALAAPTGKAAARLQEAVHDEAAGLDIGDAVRRRLGATEAVTLHRLLGWRPGRSTFRHNRGNRLAHEIVVVDETSMISLSLMARLVESVRPGARLILVGDPEQLASVEAGAVLGDIVGPAAGPKGTAPTRKEQTPLPTAAGIGAGIVVLRRVHRFAGEIAALAEAIRSGDADATIDVLAAGSGNVAWLDVDVADPAARAALGAVRQAAVHTGQQVMEAARAGRGADALDALGRFRLLCAHRRGPYGVAAWTQQVQRWLAAGPTGPGEAGAWYVGRPLLVTENDYGLRLYNGDTGVVVADAEGGVSAAFSQHGELVTFSPHRLAAVDTVYAMTIHKSQGSQFDAVAVLLPDPASRLLTRELLYTAVTRARSRLILAGTEAAVRAAVERPIARASGLRELLWGPA